MTRIVFEEVYIRSRWIFHCDKCAKRLVRCKKFTETLNPFNVHENGPLKGQVKDRAAIYASLRAKANKWQAETILCAPCAEWEAGK